MSVVRVATNFNIDLEFVSPAFYKRLLAWIIDLLILIVYIILAGKVYDYLVFRSDLSDTTWSLFMMLRKVLLLPFFLYHLVCEITMNGQSIGKKIIGIKVISENGGKPSISQYIIRWLIRTSDYFLLIMVLLIPYVQVYGTKVYVAFAGGLGLLIADLVLVNTRKQQRLGDILAHTLLIDTRSKDSINDTIFQEVGTEYKPLFPQVMQLSDRDINSLKSILDTARKRGDYNLAELASEKIRNHLKIDTSLSAFDFLEILLKDYNYLSAH